MIDFISSDSDFLSYLLSSILFAVVGSIIGFLIIAFFFKIYGKTFNFTFWQFFFPMVIISFLSFPFLLTFLAVTLVLSVSLSSGLITYAVLNFFGMNKELIYGCMTLSAFLGIWVSWKILSILYDMRMKLIAKKAHK